MAKPVATLVLNRNLGDITDRLVEHVLKFDHALTDVFVIESGSDSDKCSKYTNFRADWDEAVVNGLRYPRGFNFGLSEMLKSGRYADYDYFFLVCNDSVFQDIPTLSILLEEMSSYSKIGFLSPCDPSWGEYRMIPEGESRLFWYGNHISWMMRRSFVDAIREREQPGPMNFLYDGSNFRGYYLDVELIA